MNSNDSNSLLSFVDDTAKKHKGGRNSLSSDGERPSLITLKVSADTLESIKKGAEHDNMTVSAWLRHLAEKRVQEQEQGIDDPASSVSIALTNALRAFLDEELDRRIKAAK